MRNILASLVFVAGIILACYTGGWLMFIKPIIECIRAYDANTLTGIMIGIAILKCIFASSVASVIVWIGSIISTAIYD